MKLIVNGKSEVCDEQIMLGELLYLNKIKPDEKGVAVALNEVVVFRAKWSDTIVRDGDRIEIIRATQGG
ncbi:MAG: sulfur carrier protein ThiS [bacterium]